jgi:hypothetical protein
MIGFREILRWIRSNLVLFLVLAFLALQFMTWRAVVNLSRYFPGEPPECSRLNPCTVELSEFSLRQITNKLGR